MRIHTLNIRSDLGLISWAKYLELDAPAFRRLIREYATTLTSGLAEHGVDYSALGPALIPGTDRNEMALLFNSARVDSFRYGDVLIRGLLPLLGKDSTLSVMVGYILTQPTLAWELAGRAGRIPSNESDFGTDYPYTIYLNDGCSTAPHSLCQSDLCR